MRVLSIDPALRNTGFAVIEKRPGDADPRALAYGVIATKGTDLPSSCLVRIRERLQEVITAHRPDVCALESVIYVQSYKTAITLGAARGAAIIAAGEHGLPIFEYAPRRIKQAIVGRGAAGKHQVAFMVRSLLRLTETPPPDAADALAIGITHIHTSESGSPATTDVRRI